MTRIAALAVLILFGALWSGTAAVADTPRPMSLAMDAMRKGNWDSATRLAGSAGEVGRDVIEWHRLRAGLGTYDEMLAFIDRRADWPGLAWLRRKSEPAVARAGTEDILSFFAYSPPQTPDGVLAYARAQAASGQAGEAEATVVLAWRTMPMGRVQQASFTDRYGELLKPHHAARLDRMLWDANISSARRMLPLVGPDIRALAEARIALHDLAPGVDARIEAVPEALQSDPGLTHGRFEWRVRKGRGEDAKALLIETSTSPEALGEPGKWSNRRRALARQEMRNGNPERAYEIAARHFLTEGSHFADLEWLAGFIALRKLDDPATALRHFERFDAGVKSPISKGRAGYWLGRAHEALGNEAAAQAAYAAGADHQTSFYGLLAAERAGLPFDPDLASPPEPGPWRAAAFADASVFQAAVLLLNAGESSLAERFLTHLVETLDPVEAAQLGAAVIELNEPHIAVMVGKRAAQRALVLPAPYFAMHPVGRAALPMSPAMTLAIARRESEFDPQVVSGAGARGLMQVMPGTARDVASALGILSAHSTERLLDDWEYNAKLGATYLARLAATFDGNVVMMSAGYNAGPGRPIRWMSDYGDPRTGAVDMVDWIEGIPFRETRNYVMRVTESLPVYRARLGQPPLPIPFSAELTGSTLRAFAP